jgi:D-glycero-D-manno-heptose 1,7-bisphosphate phosphatase
MTLSDRKTPAVFVDRDGVICENRSDYVKTWSEFVFVPGSVEALASLSNVGARLFVVTNQAVVGRGLISRRQLDVMHEKMLDVLSGAGAKIEGILVCAHHPDDRCDCRKPKPGLLLDAALRFKIDLEGSFMIGDAASDIEAGARAGTGTVLVLTGRGKESIEVRSFGKHKPDFIADDLVDAAIWVMGQQTMRAGGRAAARARR